MPSKFVWWNHRWLLISAVPLRKFPNLQRSIINKQFECLEINWVNQKHIFLNILETLIRTTGCGNKSTRFEFTPIFYATSLTFIFEYKNIIIYLYIKNHKRKEQQTTYFWNQVYLMVSNNEWRKENMCKHLKKSRWHPSCQIYKQNISKPGSEFFWKLGLCLYIWQLAHYLDF